MLPVIKLEEKVTLHDPCYVTRLAGFGEMERELIDAVARQVVEMTPCRERNYCCNGGAGPMRLPELAELRRRISIIKVNQIVRTGAQRVVTPCAICMLTLSDMCAFYKLVPEGRRMAFMMFEAVYEAVKRALQHSGELDRMRLPAVFRGKDKAYIQQHGLSRIVEELIHSPNILALSEWLNQDEIVQRFLRDHTGLQPPANQEGFPAAAGKSEKKGMALCGNC